MIIGSSQAQVYADFYFYPNQGTPICVVMGQSTTVSAVNTTLDEYPLGDSIGYIFVWRLKDTQGNITEHTGFNAPVWNFNFQSWTTTEGEHLARITLIIRDTANNNIIDSTSQNVWFNVVNPISIDGPLTICPGDTETWIAYPLSYFDYFTWENQTEGIQVHMTANDIDFYHGVEVCGVKNGYCYVIQHLDVEILESPEKPEINGDNDCHLISSWDFSYVYIKWYKESIFTGDTGTYQNPYYNPITPGHYGVEAMGYNGCRNKATDVWSDCNVTGFEFEDSEISEIEVYPNPFQNELNISLPEDGQLHSVQLINLLGEKVAEVSGYGDLKIERKNLLPGIYFVRTDSGRSTKVTAQ